MFNNSITHIIEAKIVRRDKQSYKLHNLAIMKCNIIQCKHLLHGRIQCNFAAEKTKSITF